MGQTAQMVSNITDMIISYNRNFSGVIEVEFSFQNAVQADVFSSEAGALVNFK